jgi:hypothetical protein
MQSLETARDRPYCYIQEGRPMTFGLTAVRELYACAFACIEVTEAI